MDKKGQYDIIMYIIFIMVLFIGAPILFKVVTSTLTPLGASMATISPQANVTANYIMNSYVNFWDFAILFGFLGYTILLLLSAFMVDVHPVFLPLYIILCFVAILIIPLLYDPVDTVNTAMLTAPSVLGEPSMLNHMDYTDYLRSHITIIMLGILILSGILTYGKMRSGNSMGGGSGGI